MLIQEQLLAFQKGMKMGKKVEIEKIIMSSKGEIVAVQYTGRPDEEPVVQGISDKYLTLSSSDWPEEKGRIPGYESVLVVKNDPQALNENVAFAMSGILPGGHFGYGYKYEDGNGDWAVTAAQVDESLSGITAEDAIKLRKLYKRFGFKLISDKEAGYLVPNDGVFISVEERGITMSGIEINSKGRIIAAHFSECQPDEENALREIFGKCVAVHPEESFYDEERYGKRRAFSSKRSICKNWGYGKKNIRYAS